MPLKLISNTGRPNLDGLGSIKLDSGKIYIVVEPNSKATITRDGKEIVLTLPKNETVKITGLPQVNDIYTIEQGYLKLIVTVEPEKDETQPEIFVNTDSLLELNNQGRKTTLTAGVVLLTLLIISVVFGIKQKNNKDFQKNSEQKLLEAVQYYESSINSTDKSEARKNFISSKEIATDLKENGYKSDKLDKLVTDISSHEQEIVGEIKPEVKEFLDLTLQTSGFEGSNMASSGEDIFVFDQSNNSIIKVGIKNKSAKIASNKENTEGTQSVGSYEDRLFLSKDDGIYEVDVVARKVIESDWNSTKLIYLYAGNLYLIDKVDNQIFRFAGSGKSFAPKSEWLAPGVEIDFSKVVDMTIDGSIWTLSESGKVTKFTNGNPQSMSLSGIVETLENSTAIYTNENLKNVYILDKNKGRVVVIDKSGEFKLQYVNEEFKKAIDIVVSEAEQKAILLMGGKLIFFEIK